MKVRVARHTDDLEAIVGVLSRSVGLLPETGTLLPLEFESRSAEAYAKS